jgi:hypothetical protein
MQRGSRFFSLLHNLRARYPVRCRSRVETEGRGAGTMRAAHYQEPSGERPIRHFRPIPAAVAAALALVLCVLLASAWLRAGVRGNGPVSSQIETAAAGVVDVFSVPEPIYLLLFGVTLALLGRSFARRRPDSRRRDVSCSSALTLPPEQPSRDSAA